MSVDVKKVFDEALKPFIGTKWYCCDLDFSELQNEKTYNYALLVVMPYDEIMTLEDYEEQRQWNMCLRRYSQAEAVRNALTKACEENNIPFKIPRHSVDHMTPPYMVILSNKYLGTKCGVGWIGKNDLLITKDYGPRVWMQSAVFYAEHMETCTPVTESECGDCDLCVKACPCKNIVGKTWHEGISRDELVDYHNCSVFRFNVSKVKKTDHKWTCARCMLSCPRGIENVRKIAEQIKDASLVQEGEQA